MGYADVVDGMDYGVGIDSLNGKIRGDAVVRSEAEPIPGAVGNRTEIIISLVETRQELESAINFSADLSAAVGLFAASPKFSLMETCAFEANSVWLVVHATVWNAFKQMRDVQLKPEAEGLLTSGQADLFRTKYGDSFCRGFRTGGEFACILRILTTSKEDQTGVKAALNAVGILGPVDVNSSTDYSQRIRQATTNHDLKLFLHQAGGSDNFSVQPAEIIEHTLTFARRMVATNSAVPYTTFFIDYATLPVQNPPNPIDLQNAREMIASTMNERADLLVKLNNVNYILIHPEQFEAVSPGVDLNAYANALKDAVNKLTNAASHCANNFHDCPLAQINVPNVQLPGRIGGATAPASKTVPDLNNLSKGQAESTIRLAGLNPIQGNDNPSTTYANGLVVGQEPSPGAQVGDGTSVMYHLGNSTLWIHLRASYHPSQRVREARQR